MRRYILLHILSITFIFLYSPIVHAIEERGIKVVPVSPTGHQVRGNQWLFVIGINTYIEWSRLNTAVNDARTVKDILLKRYHFDKHHLIELYDEDATRSNILGKLRFLARRVGPDDSVVIFYAGHGHLDSITKSGSWIPVESGIENTSAWISNHDIKEYLKIDAIKAKHVLLISDSCFSGDFFRGNRGRLPEVTDEVIKRAYKLSSRQAITSGGLEPVVDAGFSGNSVFTHFLVKTLEENNKPFLIPSDLFPDIKAGVAENAEQFPRYGTLKDTGGQQGGELVFFLKQYGSDIDDKVKGKQAELERLKELERQSQAAREKEQAEIAIKEEELARLDKKITEMKERLGTTAANTGDSLDTMLAMIEDKRNQEKRIEELRIKRETEERKRLAEIERLKIEQAKKSIEVFNKDIRKYEKIVSSEYGSDMKKTAWNNLVSRYQEGRGLAIGDINGLKLKIYPKIRLRSSYKDLSAEKVRLMSNMSFHGDYGEVLSGYSTINHIYEKKLINGDKVVIDHASDLMWHQSGWNNEYKIRDIYKIKDINVTWKKAKKEKYATWKKAKKWLRKLNRKGYAGYKDWRLPTLEEAASLLESNIRNGLHIDPVFSNEYVYMLTGDVHGSEDAWGIYFNFGYVDYLLDNMLGRYWFSVRPVRSMK